MPHRRTTAPDSWPPPWMPFSGPPDLSMLLGRLLERSEYTAASVDEIRDRLEAGDRKFERHGERLDELHGKIEKLQGPPKDPVTVWERLSKDGLRWAIIATILYAKGLDAAIEMAGKVGMLK